MNLASCKSLMLAVMMLCAVVNDLHSDERVVALIDRMIDVERPDTGYAQLFSGHNFSPYEDTEALGTMILGGTARDRSEVMRDLVKSGFDAVPDLIKHLSDERKTKLPPIESGGMMWIAFENRYDFNRATINTEPKGVNVDSFPKFDEAENHPSHHEITVGDLCFVALGQIVNREWSACQYQPTGGRIINSPTYSEALRDAILNEWGKLDRDSHRQRLIDDFQKPDSEYRLVGAYLRLSLYYPDEIEKLLLELLQCPIPDSDKMYEFIEQLLATKDTDARRRKLADILSTHGQHYREGMQNYLFMKISSADLREKNGFELSHEELTAREILHEAFDWPKDVKFGDWHKKPRTTFDNGELSRVIKALTHDDSIAIGNEVKTILESDRFKNDSYMKAACLTCLASRMAFGDYLAGKLERINFQTATQKEMRADYLAAVARSKAPQVQTQLRRIAESSNEPNLFLIAAKAVEKDASIDLLQRAKGILKGMPIDTSEGKGLLSWVVEKSPEEAEAILTDFLKPNTRARCHTVCDVLWYGNPVSPKVLSPLLDDKRSIPSSHLNVRECAAYAISHSIGTIKFASDWSESKKENAIRQLKEFCQRK